MMNYEGPLTDSESEYDFETESQSAHHYMTVVPSEYDDQCPYPISRRMSDEIDEQKNDQWTIDYEPVGVKQVSWLNDISSAYRTSRADNIYFSLQQCQQNDADEIERQSQPLTNQQDDKWNLNLISPEEMEIFVKRCLGFEERQETSLNDHQDDQSVNNTDQHQRGFDNVQMQVGDDAIVQQQDISSGDQPCLYPDPFQQVGQTLTHKRQKASPNEVEIDTPPNMPEVKHFFQKVMIVLKSYLVQNTSEDSEWLREQIGLNLRPKEFSQKRLRKALLNQATKERLHDILVSDVLIYHLDHKKTNCFDITTERIIKKYYKYFQASVTLKEYETQKFEWPFSDRKMKNKA